MSTRLGAMSRRALRRTSFILVLVGATLAPCTAQLMVESSSGARPSQNASAPNRPALRTQAQAPVSHGLLSIQSLAGQAQFTRIQRLTNADVSFQLTAPADFNFRVEISTNLQQWTPLITFPKSASALVHTDSAAPLFPARYFRAVQLPATNVMTGDHLATASGDVVIHPINHATLVMDWNGKIIYADPVGGASRFSGLPPPQLILLTDIHTDHLDVNTLNSINAQNADIIAPSSVFQSLSATLRAKTKTLANGEKTDIQGLSIEAIPMYNTTASRLSYHTKGRGNGYVLTMGEKRIYISGDTEDIPEMRALQNIDLAFVCMNLPYTMDINQAAGAVRAFRPKIVYPFHYQGSDVNKFKQLVGTDLSIEVRLRKWY